MPKTFQVRIHNARASLAVSGTFVLPGTVVGRNPGTPVFTLKDSGGAAVNRFVPPRILGVSSPGGRSNRFHAVVQMRDVDGHPLAEGDYTLTATPTYRDGKHYPNGAAPPVPITHRRTIVKGLDVRDYPPDNHTLSAEESDFLYATGESDVAVWNAYLTSDDPNFSRWANYVFWVSELNYWVAEFLYLGSDPGPGTYTLNVDAPGYTPKTIHVP